MPIGTGETKDIQGLLRWYNILFEYPLRFIHLQSCNKLLTSSGCQPWTVPEFFTTTTSSYVPVICNHCPHPHLRGLAYDSGANVRGSDLLSVPAVPDNCRACDITQIYPRGIYYYKEQG